MATDLAKTARGALAGAVAAGVWAAQQPLDMKVFGVRYDDTELLGKAVTRGPLWRPAGVALHVANGALFGALYAAIAPRVQLPSWSRGPLAGLGEHLATWPFTALLPAIHPARDDLSEVNTARGFWQATWRHALFGVVLGELERRLNPPDEEPELAFEAVISTNGHGRIEDAVSA